jgi:hypothetical protein
LPVPRRSNNAGDFWTIEKLVPIVDGFQHALWGRLTDFGMCTAAAGSVSLEERTLQCPKDVKVGNPFPISPM